MKAYDRLEFTVALCCAICAVIFAGVVAEADPYFAASVEYAVGSSPCSVAIIDLDDDGAADLITSNYLSQNVSVLLGGGDGTFGTAANFGVGVRPRAIAADDLNGDGCPDLVTANQSSGNVSVLLGSGDGTFGTAVNYGAGNAPWAVAIDDMNGDGDPDLAVANYHGHDVSVLLGNGDGTFGAAVHYIVGDIFVNPHAIAAADLDDDGAPDLVMGCWDYQVKVLMGAGDGTFSLGNEYCGTGDAPVSVAIDDLDADGMPDLAVACSGGGFGLSAIVVHRGDGDGTFGAAEYYADGGSYPVSIAIDDLDNDGIPDLIAAIEGPNRAAVFSGNGDGTFGPAIRFTAGEDPSSVASGDLNGDGLPDLVVANSADDSVSVLINWDAGSTISAELACLPDAGTIPFTTQMTVRLENIFPGMSRRVAGRIDVDLAGGQHYGNWKTGWSNLAAGESFVAIWNQTIPDVGSTLGANAFALTAEDVTPAPYNQPPYPPSGDNDTDICTVTGIAP